MFSSTDEDESGPSNFLGQGTYGCVYFDENRSNVTKLVYVRQGDEEESMREIVISRMFEKYEKQIRHSLDGYFAGIVSTRSLTMSDIEAEYGQIDIECNVVKKIIDKARKTNPEKTTPEINNNMKFLALSEKFVGTNSYGTFLRELRVAKVWVAGLWDEFCFHIRHISDSLYLLRKMKILHYDLKENNILLKDSGIKIPIIIDFGLALPIPKVLKIAKGLNEVSSIDFQLLQYFYNTSTEYAPWGLDICILCKLIDDRFELGEKGDVEMVNQSWREMAFTTINTTIQSYWSSFRDVMTLTRQKSFKQEQTTYYYALADAADSLPHFYQLLIDQWRQWDIQAFAFLLYLPLINSNVTTIANSEPLTFFLQYLHDFVLFSIPSERAKHLYWPSTLPFLFPDTETKSHK